MRLQPLTPRPLGATLTDQRIRAMIEAGVKLLAGAVRRDVPTASFIVSTRPIRRKGIKSLQPVADLGRSVSGAAVRALPWAAVCFAPGFGERACGRGGRRRHQGCAHGRKGELPRDEAAERITGFDQAPDFIIPDEFNPVALIEAKLTEDDGTAPTRARKREPGQAAKKQSAPWQVLENLPYSAHEVSHVNHSLITGRRYSNSVLNAFLIF